MRIGSDCTTEHHHFSHSTGTRHALPLPSYFVGSRSVEHFRYTGNCRLFEHQAKIAAMEVQLKALMDAEKEEEQDGIEKEFNA